MKKLIPIFFLLIGFIFTSCAPEQIEELNNTTVDSPNNREHNLVWKGKNYLLIFDSAYARIHSSVGILGCGPAIIKFHSLYHDKYTGQRFRFWVGVGASVHGDSDNRYYVASEVQSKLDDVAQFIIYPPSYQSRGSELVFTDTELYYGPPVYHSNTPNLHIELLSFSTYKINTDKMADFHVKITADNLAMDLEGKFRAQDND
jgi:hypothetical protein